MLFVKIFILFIINYVFCGGIQVNFDINRMLKLVNNARAQVGSRPLKLDNGLIYASQLHSDDQAYMNTMSHTGSDGSDISERLDRVGIRWSTCGENVAWNQRSVDEVMDSWIKSPGHYANIINRDFRKFGAGMTNYYWSQAFSG